MRIMEILLSEFFKGENCIAQNQLFADCYVWRSSWWVDEYFFDYMLWYFGSYRMLCSYFI